MSQHYLRTKTQRRLHRVALLITTALFLLIVISIVSPQLIATAFQPGVQQVESGAAPITLSTSTNTSVILAAVPTRSLPATATVTATALPTALPTQSPVASPTSMADLSHTVALIGIDGAALVSEPEGTALQTLTVGAVVRVRDRSADGSWLQIMTSENVTGWITVDSALTFAAPDLLAADPEEQLTNATLADADKLVISSQTAVATTVGSAPTPSSPATTAAATQLAPDEQVLARVTVRGTRLNVRTGPGTQYPILAKAVANDTFTTLARNRDATWVQIALPTAKSGFGWVSATYVNLSNPITNLPISDEIGSAPAAAPTSPPITSATTTTVTTSQPTAQQTAQRGQPTGLSGKLVVQSQGGGTFYLYDLASGALRALTNGIDPALSPDGRQVAFARTGSANGIYLIDIDGANERKIFSERSGLRSPKWSPNGQWIAFSRADGEYHCRDVGQGGVCLSDSQLVGGVTANLSPGQKQAVEQTILGQFDQISKPNWMIARINAVGTEYRDLPALNSALAPDWTNAGIVYQSSGGLQRTDDRPDAQTQKIYFDYNLWDPDWQPGPKDAAGRIVFQLKQGPHWEIFAVNPDGSGVTALTRPATALVTQMPSNVAPAWSPDGRHIAFLSNREADGEAGQWRVWVMNSDGSNQRSLPLDIPLTYTFSLEQMVDWGS